ncbi:SMC-Scp complex subunit ScpB [Candidatus Woesearchaeota archaeon]|nr:MAG: SMC-Scp complex subunit ScpB [Candidatus Woesearchaeota archaeon]
MEDILNKVESVLFSVGKKVDVEFIRQLWKVRDSKIIEEALKELKKVYDERASSLQVVQEGDFWKLTVRDKYAELARRIIPETEMSKAVMETLAVIAWKQPVLQSEVIRVRTNKAYEHIKELEEMGFITTEKFGRTKKLKITQKFLDYFDIGGIDDIKEFFKKMREKQKEEQKELSGKDAEIARLVQGIAQAAEEQSIVSNAISESQQELEGRDISEASQSTEENSRIGPLEVYDADAPNQDGEDDSEAGEEAPQRISYPSDEEVKQRHEIHEMLSETLESKKTEESNEESEIRDSLDSEPALRHPSYEPEPTEKPSERQHEMPSESEAEREPAGSEAASEPESKTGEQHEFRKTGIWDDDEDSAENEKQQEDAIQKEKSNLDKLFEEDASDQEDEDEEP